MRPDGRCGVAVDGDRGETRQMVSRAEVSVGQMAITGPVRHSLREFFSCRPSRVISQPRPRFRSSVSYTD
jgi:hypothetical protein